MTKPTRHAGPGPDAFEVLLRRRLGPAGVAAPPPALHAAILTRVAGLPPAEARFRLRPATLATALSLGFLGLVAGWLLTRPGSGLGGLFARVGHALSSAEATPTGLGKSMGLLFGHAGWLELVKSPLALAVLPLLCLPLLYLLQDENSRR
jgi:hypothetical protein